jgi:hypothetical protein
MLETGPRKVQGFNRWKKVVSNPITLTTFSSHISNRPMKNSIVGCYPKVEALSLH